MRNLDARYRALLFQKSGDPRERFNLLIFPKPHVAWRNAAGRFHRRRLHNDAARAAHRSAA